MLRSHFSFPVSLICLSVGAALGCSASDGNDGLTLPKGGASAQAGEQGTGNSGTGVGAADGAGAQSAGAASNQGGNGTGAQAAGGAANGGADDTNSDDDGQQGDDDVADDNGGNKFIDGDDDVFLEDTKQQPVDGGLVDGAVCNSKDVSFEPLNPTMMILVDKSTSMFAGHCATNEQGAQYCGGDSPPFGAYPDRWEALREALKSLEPYSSDVAMSIATYTSDASSDTCPIMGNLETAPATNNFAELLGTLKSSAEDFPSHKGDTPTGEAILAATEALLAVPADGKKYLLLATDGEPDGCLRYDPQCGHDPAIAAVQDAFAAGITTFVIGLGSDAGEKFLNDMAHAGIGDDVEVPPEQGVDGKGGLSCIKDNADDRGEAADDFYYPADNWRKYALSTYAEDTYAYTESLYLKPGDDAALQEALAGLVAGVRTCEFEMGTAIKRSRADEGAVQITYQDGTDELLTYEGPNGWLVSPDNDYTVVVQGTACDAIQEDVNGTTTLRIEFPCDIQVPIIR